MKAPVKYTIFSILYETGDEGMWEYDIYQLLKSHYPGNSLTKLREVLIEFGTKSWTEILETKLYNDEIIRKYKLQDRHREFLAYQLNPQKILQEMGITVKI